MDGTDMQGWEADVLKRGQFEEAIALYIQRVEANPEDLTHYWQLGLAYLLHGNQAEAQEVWVSAFMSLPTEAMAAATDDLVQLLTGAAQQQLEAGHRALAIQILQQVVELDDGQADIHYSLGHLLAQQGRLDEAIATWQQAITLNPTLTEAYKDLAELFQRLEQFDEAIAWYTQVLQANPGCLTATYHLGVCLLHQHRFDEAIPYFQRATQIDPSFAPAYGDGGMVLVLQGQLSTGVAQLHQAIALNPAFAQNYEAWADALENQDARNPAIRDSAIRHNADLLQGLCHAPSANLFWTLGIVLAERGLVKGAIACFHQAANLDPSLTAPMEAAIQTLNLPTQSSPPLHQPDPSVAVDVPNGFYESTWEWAVASGLETSHFWPMYSASNLQFVEPKTLDNPIDIRFRFGDGILLPGSFVVDVPKGRYWVDEQHQTAVITPDNKLLGDVSPDFPILSPGHPDKHASKHSIFRLNRLPQPTQIGGRVAVLSSLFNDAYFHWMFDVLPRVELLRLSGIDLTSIDYFLVNNQWPFQQESLERLAIPPDRILTPATHPHIQADHLIVPSFPGAISWMPRWPCDFLRHVFGAAGAIAPSSPKHRLFISRNQTTNRRLINEVEITKLLEEFGFQAVILESLSIVEQAKLFANAQIVIAPHGGGLTNLVFCQPGTKVIELFSPNYVYSCYWLVSNLMNLDYYYLLGEVPAGIYFNQLLHPNPRTEDMVIDPSALLGLCKFL